ncbi:MAG: A/G-specific adenine glycosylase [Pseudomonadota bacterium]
MIKESPPIAETLLAWYDRHARRLPWRAPPGQWSDPYEVWLSEIMLQQTTVAAVGPYFKRFMARWPRVEDLAAAPLDDVLVEWAGLGYYARARNLHKCARAVAAAGGRFPETEAELLGLPGVGLYTAAAIAAIAFGAPATVVDGNVERVVARLRALEMPLPDVKPEIRARAAELTPKERPGDYAQAMMDLGATLCLPKRPKCLTCPLSTSCQARALGLAEELPRRRPKTERPTRRAVAFWLTDPSGAVLLRRRPEKGLLGGMMELPSTPWRAAPWPEEADARAAAPLETDWIALPGLVRHTFTHFHLEARVWAGQTSATEPPNDGRWVPLDGLSGQALPSVMRKLVRHALERSAEL